MAEPLKPSREDVRSFLIATLVVGAAYSGYKGVLDPLQIALFMVFGAATLFLRELGQRTVANWIEVDVDTELSQEGSIVGIMVSGFSYLSVFSFLFLAPVSSSFSQKDYEHWGKGQDSLWPKRPYWIASSGIVTLLVGWTISYTLGAGDLAELISIFTFFQLLPLNDDKHLSGRLDGVHIIIWTGFTWIVLIGLTIAAMALSII
jgi:hypothetical protein